MLASLKKSLLATFVIILVFALSPSSVAQSGGNSTSVTGIVKDPSSAVVPNATVEIRNPVSAFVRTTSTDSCGRFTIPNVPFNPYHLTVTGNGFDAYVRDIDTRSIVPLSLNISRQVKGSSETVTVEAGG